MKNIIKTAVLIIIPQIPLTPREIEVIIQVAFGLTSALIAKKFFISKETVEKHRSNIFAKTKCKDAGGAVAYVLHNKYCTLKQITDARGTTTI